VWIDEDGKELVYKPSGHPVIGGVYAMEIVRDGEKITRYGDGEYSHRSEDAELVARLEAEDRIARVQIEQAALARNDMKTSELDKILQPLLDIAGGYIDPAKREALAAYVTRRIHTARRRP